MEERRQFKSMTAAEQRQYWSLSAAEADVFLHQSAAARTEYMEIPTDVRQAKWRAREQDAVLGLTPDEQEVYATLLTKDQRSVFLALGMASKAREKFVRLLAGEGFARRDGSWGGRARAGVGEDEAETEEEASVGPLSARKVDAIKAAEAGAQHARYFWNLVSGEKRTTYLAMTFEQREVLSQLTKEQEEVCWYMSNELRNAFCRLNDDQRKKCTSLAAEERSWDLLMSALETCDAQAAAEGGGIASGAGTKALFASGRAQQGATASMAQSRGLVDVGSTGSGGWKAVKASLQQSVVWESTMRPLQAKGFSASESCTPLLLPFREAESVEEMTQALGRLVMVLEQWAQHPEVVDQTEQRLPEHRELLPIAFRHKNVMRWDSHVEELFTQAQQALEKAVSTTKTKESEAAIAKAAIASKSGGLGMPASLRAHTLRPNMSAADVAAADKAGSSSALGAAAASRASVAAAAGAGRRCKELQSGLDADSESYHPQLVIWTDAQFKDGVRVR
jgi:hypothetical protein